MKQESLHQFDIDRNRRQFLQFILLITGSIVASFGRKLIEPILHQYQAKKESSIDVQAFLEQHQEKLQKIELGCTFSPEHFVLLAPEVTPDQVVAILKELLIKKVRFTMRWDRCLNEDFEIDLSFYEPWLTAFAQAGFELTLSLGPIKTPRYPESFVPTKVIEFLQFVSSQTVQKNKINISQLTETFGEAFIKQVPDQILLQIREKGFLPRQQQVVTAESPLALFSLEYLEKLLPALQKLLGTDLSSIKMFNPENEFRNPFGTGKYIMSLDYMIEVCKRIISIKPDAAFLLNSAGISNSTTSALEQSVSGATVLQEAFPGTEFTIGLDLYEEQDLVGMIPMLNFHPDTITGLLVMYHGGLLKNVAKNLEELDIHFEATELQFERWGEPKRKYPPGAVYHLQYMLLRFLTTFLGNSQQTVRLWGIEQFIKKYVNNPNAAETQALRQLIVAINSKTFDIH